MTIRPVFMSLAGFQAWLDGSGRGYLQAGLGDMDVGDAMMEICRRAGIRGIRPTDTIISTLPMIADLIELRCKPRSTNAAR